MKGKNMYSKIYNLVRLFWPAEMEMRRHLEELGRLEKLSQPDLQAWQLDQLQRLVRHAYENVPYYRERYQQEGIHPEDIKTLQDFGALPTITKEDVNANLDKLVSPTVRGKLYSNQTGGSTGQPMRFFVEDSFWRWNIAQEFRGRSWYGVHPGDKIAWVWGAARDMPDWSWKRRLRAYLNRHRYLNAFGMTEAKMQAFAQMLVRWQPAMFRAYASALSLFAQYLQEHKITGIRPRMIETTAEKVTQPQRQLLEEVFQCKVADSYAARELATIAYQCPAGGLHVCETRYLEIIAHGQVAPPGQMGEVAITSLHQYAMPLIRYKIGDMAAYQPSPCPCGRSLPVLREIVGRTHDFLVTADGQFVHGEFFAYLFRVQPQVARYQVHQPDKEHLEVRLVCRQPVDQAWLDRMHQELQTRFGQSMHISLCVVDNIELTAAGKHRYIVSEVKPDFM